MVLNLEIYISNLTYSNISSQYLKTHATTIHKWHFLTSYDPLKAHFPQAEKYILLGNFKNMPKTLIDLPPREDYFELGAYEK